MLLLILVTLFVVTLLAIGVTLSIVDVDRYNFALYLILLGIVSLCVVVALWIVRPSALMKWPRFCQRLCPACFGPKKYRMPESKVILDPTDAEAVMKNIRGIPYLMQAIQYSMETTYYTDMMSQMGSGPVQASVIHAAPGCRSLLDSDTESDCCCHCGAEDQQMPSVFVEHPLTTPRSSLPDEQWEPTNSLWSNAQLRLDIARRQSYLPVFPLSEAVASAARAARLDRLQEGYAVQSLDRLNYEESGANEGERWTNEEEGLRRDDENDNLLKVGDFTMRKSSSATLLYQCRRPSSCSCRSSARKTSNSNTNDSTEPRANIQVMRLGKNGVFMHKRPPMLYACLGVCFCVSVGLTGLMLSIIDIERYNFGLYLTLLAVVGTTIAIAFWIVKPEMCSSPEWFDRAATVLSIQMSTTFGKKKRRRRSAKSNKSASSMPTTSFRRHSTKRRRPVSDVGEEAQRRSHSAQPPHALNSTPPAAPVCRRSSTVARIQLTCNDENSAAIATNSVHTEMSPLMNNYLGKKRSSTWYSLYKKTAGDDSAFHDSPASSLSHAPCSCLFPMELHEQASQTEITATASQKLLLISGCEDEGMISSSREQSSIAHLPRSLSDNPAAAHSPFFSSYLPIDSDDSYQSDKDRETLSLPKLKAQPAAIKYSLSRLFFSKLSADGAKRGRSSSSDWLPSWRRRSPSVEYDTEEITYV